MFMLPSKQLEDGMLLIKAVHLKSGLLFLYYEDEIPNIKDPVTKQYFEEYLKH